MWFRYCYRLFSFLNHVFASNHALCLQYEQLFPGRVFISCLKLDHYFVKYRFRTYMMSEYELNFWRTLVHSKHPRATYLIIEDVFPINSCVCVDNSEHIRFQQSKPVLFLTTTEISFVNLQWIIRCNHRVGRIHNRKWAVHYMCGNAPVCARVFESSLS